MTCQLLTESDEFLKPDDDGHRLNYPQTNFKLNSTQLNSTEKWKMFQIEIDVQ